MAALVLKWQHSLAIGMALALGPPAFAADVSVQLDAGAGLSVKNSTGAIERLRVDEATGNLSRNGALFVHTTGTSNTFVGVNAGNTSTTGIGRNSAFGNGALRFNTTGRFNSAFGGFALYSNTAGNYNSAVGSYALRSNTTGYGNSAVGASALRFNTTGDSNSAVGGFALYSNITGIQNSAVGSYALRSNTSGSRNSAVGFYSLRANTSGSTNSAVGFYALRSNTMGVTNSAFGNRALYSNTTGNSNAAVGGDALYFNSTGTLNSAVGSSALRENTNGFENAAVGSSALRENTTGVANSAVGSSALRQNTTGNANSAVGRFALFSNTTGLSNSAFGNYALDSNTTGDRNVAVGLSAGANQTTGNDNIYLANVGLAAESGQIKIGTFGTHTTTRIAGIRGVTTGAADAVTVLIDSTGQLGTLSSSRRVKREIRDMGDATDRLLALRPVMFRYQPEQTLPSGEPPPEYGLIAEEVAEVFPDLVVYDEAGLPFTVKYHVMAPMLLNEMQKQRHTIETQRKEYQKEIAALTTRLALVEERTGAGAASKGGIR